MKCKNCNNQHSDCICQSHTKSQKLIQSLIEIEGMEQAINNSFSKKEADILRKEIAKRNKKIKQNFGKK